VRHEQYALLTLAFAKPSRQNRLDMLSI